MTEVYTPDQSTRALYHHAIQTGRGDSSYVYSVQDGAGIGSFFKRIIGFATPLIKKIGKQFLYKGKELLEPELKKLVKAGADTATRIAADKIQEYSQKATDKIDSIGRKRKVDSLDG